MQVTFKSAQTIGNRQFKAGKQMVQAHLAGNQKFKQLVFLGQIVIHSRDSAEQSVQAEKDKHNAKKAELARKMTEQVRAAKAQEKAK